MIILFTEFFTTVDYLIWDGMIPAASRSPSSLVSISTSVLNEMEAELRQSESDDCSDQTATSEDDDEGYSDWTSEENDDYSDRTSVKDDDYWTSEEDEYTNKSPSSTLEPSESQLELRECAMKADDFESFKQLAMANESLSIRKRYTEIELNLGMRYYFLFHSPSYLMDALFRDYRELLLKQRQAKQLGTDEGTEEDEELDTDVEE